MSKLSKQNLYAEFDKWKIDHILFPSLKKKKNMYTTAMWS